VGGVPGGVPGGTPSGVIGGIIGGLPSAAPPPPPPPKEAPKPATPSRIRVGGNVQQASLVRQARPVYPPLAKQARIQGTVRFEAVIAKDGTIQNLRVVSGHPLLVQAATDAVKQWVYKPTLLNGEAVEVVTTIDVNFTLAG
jgi:periplasmic protein TonB